MRGIFIDRDGTINIDRGYLGRFSDFELLPNAVDGLLRLGRLGRLVIITNQSGIGRGYYTEEALNELHREMTRMLGGYGVRIDGIYYCPHLPHDISENREACACRKPAPGMILQAAQDLGIDLAQSYMIGDKASDVEAGICAGAKTAYITGGKPLPDGLDAKADFIVYDLLEAANRIEGDCNGTPAV